MCYHLEDAADRVSGAQNLIDFGFHPLFGIRIGAIEQHFVAAATYLDLFPGDLALNVGTPNRHHMTQDFDAELLQKRLCQGSDSDPGGGFSSRSPFQNVSGFRKVVLQGTCKVGMAGARRCNPLM